MKRKLFALLVLAATAGTMQAQVNPKQGYVITNEGDTIHGTISYRTDARNANECLFCADGETTYRSYAPADIYAYRLAEDGIFYVRRTFPVEGAEKTFFAEFLLQGGISLYRHVELGKEYFYLENEEGQVAEIQKKELKAQSNYEAAREKRENLNDAIQMLNKSPKAQEQLWRNDLTPRNMTALTRQYNETYCTETSCIAFQYDEKAAAPVKVRFRAEAGVYFASIKRAAYKEIPYNFPKLDMSCTSPVVGIGIDAQLPRLSRSLSLQVLALFSHWSLSTTDTEWLQLLKDRGTVSFSLLEGNIGAAYSFLPGKKVSPLLRAGYSFGQILGMKDENLKTGKRTFSVAKNEMCNGYYVGGGADATLGRHVVRLSLNYTWRKESQSQMEFPTWALQAGFLF